MRRCILCQLTCHKKPSKQATNMKPGRILYYKSIYRLDDESRWLWDLDNRGNQKFRRPERIARGHLTGFQGELNPVVTDDSSSNVFRL